MFKYNNLDFIGWTDSNPRNLPKNVLFPGIDKFYKRENENESENKNKNEFDLKLLSE